LAAPQRRQAIRQANELRQQAPAANAVQQPIQPRIYNPRGDGGSRQPRVFTPNPTVIAPPQVQEPQPAPAVTSPTLNGTVDPATRTWTGRGGATGTRGDWGPGGRTRGDWGTRGGIEGNQDWRDRRNGNDGSVDEHANHSGRRGWRERHREWHNRHEGDPNFAQAHRRWHRQHQSRDWWRSRYSRFARFGGGYYYWNAGYWYPAYGYDPYFTTYTYDAPIYAYDDQDPGRIIASVQRKLQRLGYYRGYLDGTYGPMTRRALLNYQRDNGLRVTGEIDQDTLASLGFE
jgi:N-acetylmuramoyl-L-alanine amidase